MNLDLDDPLGDLLSDGSNDSFFGIETSKKGKDQKVKDESSGGNKMESLFGITSESKPKPSSDTLTEPSIPRKPSTPPKKALEPVVPRLPTPQKHDEPKTDAKNTGKIESELGFDPKKPKKKSNILDELLGIDNPTPQKSNVFTKPSGRDPSPPMKTISRQTTFETTSDIGNPESGHSGYTPSSARKSGRRQSAVAFSDPLGLFSSDKEKEQTVKVSKASRKSIAGSEWLTGEVVDKAALIKLKSSPAIQITPNSEDRPDPDTSATESSKPSISQFASLPKNPQLIETLATETTNSLQNLKQQEFQLMVASQMKTQETVLLEMKHKQQELLQQQEYQFNELLRKQLLRQSELEDVIKQQQERINNHIQALMTSPSLENYSLGKSSISKADNEDKPMERIELEAEVKRLEMEKLRLEDLHSNIADNHEKEIIMIEQSYKKRIMILEENVKNIEERYKEELHSLQTFYQKKIDTLNNDKESLVAAFETKIKSENENQKSFIEKLKINYETDIETLKKHYEDMMGNIRKSKLMEFAAKEESGSYMDILRKAHSNLESASGDIQSLHETLQEKILTMEKEREIQLSQRERKIEGKFLIVFCFKVFFYFGGLHLCSYDKMTSNLGKHF